MPELPEVETVVRQLGPRLEGRTVRALEVYDSKLTLEREPRLAGRPVEQVLRVGKQAALGLGGPEPLWLVVHLRMTGRLIWEDQPGERDRHLRARLRLDRGAVAFLDSRRFGTLRLVSSLREVWPAGLDPFAPEFDREELARLLHGSLTPIKPWLLRQDRLVGIGNIYASEILFEAGIDPHRRAGELRPEEVPALYRSIIAILLLAIDFNGTTFSDYQDASGRAGAFQELLAVYGREGRPCRRCPGTVQRIVQAQRSTFFCPCCQR